MIVQADQTSFFARTAQLSRYQMPGVIPVAEVIRVLNDAKIRFVLAGAYGLAHWRKESRGTEDVDVVVAVKQLKKAVDVLIKAFPHLEPVDLPVVIRLRERGTENVLIDVMKPLQQPVCEVFKHTLTVSSEGQTYRIPSLEMGLVMKFSAMTSLHRAAEDRHRDAHDFIRMVKNNPDLDAEKLAELASRIYPEGGKDVLEMVEKVRAGEMLQL
jgi:Nucleotidyl transferase AbiEii toxin, Type IV TA system